MARGCGPRRGGGLYDRPRDDVKRFVEPNRNIFFNFPQAEKNSVPQTKIKNLPADLPEFKVHKIQLTR